MKKKLLLIVLLALVSIMMLGFGFADTQNASAFETEMFSEEYFADSYYADNSTQSYKSVNATSQSKSA